MNFTDSESRIMLTSNNGWQQPYNLQNSVDMNSYMILGGYACQATNDKQQLELALDELQGLPGRLCTLEKIAADSGYLSEKNVEETADRQITPYIATGRSDTGPGRAFYARRKSTVEPVFGIIKRAMGFRQFLLRGLEKVNGEWKLVQCAYNLKRMHTLTSE